jgi:gamma-glutamylcyclotransferase (GGCT)/AIG2-like uncharacterized protein YtfP
MAIRFPDSEFIANARVNGRLYDVGAYPGLLLDGSDSLVTGELYEVEDETLNKLDKFELSDDYVRREVEVLQGSERKRCWIYVPERGEELFSGQRLIESGDWIKHLRSRTEPPEHHGS